MRQLSFGLGAAIENLDRARRTRAQADAETLERLAKRAGMDPRDAARLALNLAPAQRSETEPFIMLTATQNAAVTRWLRDHSNRPIAALGLWAELFTAVHPATGEVLLSRADLAARLNIEPKNVSSIMTELASINAIRREKEGRKVRYFMNPGVATHIASPEARAKARSEAGPLLVLMEGGRIA